MRLRLDTNGIIQAVIVAMLLGILSAAVSTYIEVRELRRDVDRLEVYTDQLWKAK